MLPETIDSQLQDVQYEKHATKTYRFDIENKRITGWTDGLEAFAISVRKMLSTQRYAHIIYDGNYGFDLQQFINQDIDYIKSAIQREIQETLSQDDRFRGIEDFIIKQTDKESCIIEFTVVGDDGEVPIQLEV